MNKATTSVYRLHAGGMWAPLTVLDRARRSCELLTSLVHPFAESPARQLIKVLCDIVWGCLAVSLQRSALADAQAISVLALCPPAASG